MQSLDNFYLQHDAVINETFLALRSIIKKQHPAITNEWKYGGSFFCFKGKMFCYLWVDKKTKQPYIGIVEGKRFDEPYLIQDQRKRIKIMLLNPEEDLPIEKIEHVIQKAISFYISGEISINLSSIIKTIPKAFGTKLI